MQARFNALIVVTLVVLFLALVLGAPRAFGQESVIEVHMVQTEDGQTYFDPVGILIKPGQTVRWIPSGGIHTSTAYHPANDNHEMRIPTAAEPWDSGLLLPPDAVFEHTFIEEGVYDYYCTPHERSGMVGRIIVGSPQDGPGTLPFGYSEEEWAPVPEAAQAVFPTVEEIMQKGIITWEMHSVAQRR